MSKTRIRLGHEERVCGDREVPLLGLFDAFSLKCTQLRQAVACGYDDLVRLLDKELEPMIAEILAYRAETREEAHMQLQFLNGLIRDEADDKSTVVRRSAAMSMLIDRYFRNSSNGRDGFQQPPVGGPQSALPFENVEQPLFNEAVLDCLPDRVGVITRDHRYLYANQANAQFIGKSPLSMIGCHVAEFIGEESFEKMARPAFNRCFEGNVVDYIHKGRRGCSTFTTRCRMTPLRGTKNEIIGAVIVLQEPTAVPALTG
ncbi:PAS domain-containing protein [Agrobacterium sp. fls2-241-TYG-188a]|uniref:PAS domain-containing protein n=1 Tax=Agrobacterium sp. fls2-241-TYG-188a TaxID=3040275 RepID=UPI0025504892|nr:PAS domain-containing protein [Agrobacterium sp. fls2-241-TYG-188a]